MSIPRDIQFSQEKVIIDKAKATDTQNIFPDTANINTTLATQQTQVSLASNTTNINTEGGSDKNISYQILAEPIRVTSPESIINAAIAAVNVLGQAFIRPIKEKLTNVSELSQNPTAIDSDQIKDCVDKISKKCTTIAETQANSAALANGHNITAAFNAGILTGNSFHIVSDTATVNRSPYFGVSSQDVSFQGNNSINMISDFSFGEFKQEVKFTEGSSISQSQTSLKVSTETNDDIAKINRYVGTEEISNLGKVNKVIADESLLTASGGTTQISSYDSIGVQSNNDISLTAAKSNDDSNPDANNPLSGNSPNRGGNIYLISTPSNNTSNMLVMSKSGLLHSSTENIINSSGKNTILNGSKSAVVTSTNYSYVGTPRGGMFIKAGRTFLGRLSFPSLNMPKASVVNIPSLPTLPTLPSKELESCLPKNINNPNTFEDFDPNSETILANNTTQDSVFDPSNPNLFIPKIPSPVNRVQLPRQFGAFNSFNPNEDKIFQVKLPAPSVSSPVAGEEKVAIISPFTPINILVDKYTKASTDTITNLSQTVNNSSPVSLFEYLATESELYDTAFAIATPEDLLTSNLVLNSLQESVPYQFAEDIKYIPFYTDLLKFPLDELESFNFSINDFVSSDKNKAQAILNLVKEYPTLKNKIIELIKKVTTLPGIGFLGFISGITSFGGGISNLINIPSLIQAGDFSNISSLLSPYLGDVLKGTIFSDLLNNTDLFDLGQKLTQGDLSTLQRNDLLKSTVDKIYNDKIKSTLENQVSSILGPNLNKAVPLIKDIFNKITVGETISPEEYTQKIGNVLASITGIDQLNRATDIYNELENLLKAISSGDILSIVTGNDFENVLTDIIGSKNSGTISNILNIVKDATGTYEAVKLIPELLNLLNQYNIPTLDQVNIALNCLDLFNKVKSLVSSVSTLTGGSGKSAVCLLENAGRLIQAVNTINSVGDEILDSWNYSLSEELGETVNLKELRDLFQTSNRNSNTFQIPALNTLQSEVEVLEINPESIKFKLTNLDLIKSDYNLLPKLNELIKLRVKGFYSINSQEYLIPYQTDFQYTPSVYNFIISEFNVNTNTGRAYYDNAYSSIILENSEGILYKFNTNSFGVTLIPDIADSYLNT